VSEQRTVRLPAGRRPRGGAGDGVVGPVRVRTGPYYDHLRGRIDRWLSRHAGPRYQEVRQWLFLVPDVLVLVLRLAQDRRVPLIQRLKLWGTALYILAPVDINVDLLLPFGPLDDLALALVVLESVMTATPPHVIRDNWPGEEDAMETLALLLKGISSLEGLLRRGRGRGRGRRR